MNEIKTLKEVIEVINNIATSTDFIKTTESNIIDFHFSLGMTIRNKLNLWKIVNRIVNSNHIDPTNIYYKFIKNDISHPDDISHALLVIYWRYKNNSNKNVDLLFEQYINEQIIENIIT